jgi:inorganic pyrophosphatase
VSCAHAGQNVFRSSNGREYLLEEEQRGDDEVRPQPASSWSGSSWGILTDCLFLQVVQKAADIQDAISEGANSFLFTEYKYLGVFMVSSGTLPGSQSSWLPRTVV